MYPTILELSFFIKTGHHWRNCRKCLNARNAAESSIKFMWAWTTPGPQVPFTVQPNKVIPHPDREASVVMVILGDTTPSRMPDTCFQRLHFHHFHPELRGSQLMGAGLAALERHGSRLLATNILYLFFQKRFSGIHSQWWLDWGSASDAWTCWACTSDDGPCLRWMTLMSQGTGRMQPFTFVSKPLAGVGAEDTVTGKGTE